MNFKQMRYFVAVVESGSFCTAAELIPVAQSALSRHIRLLEEEFGNKLLSRTARGVELTEQGEYLYKRSKDVLEQKKDIEQALVSWYDHPSGQVRIGMPPTIVLGCIADILGLAHKKYPAVTVDVNEHLSSEISKLLKMRSLDVGIVLEQRPSDKLTSEYLYNEELLLVTSREMKLKEPVSLQDIAEMPLIIPDGQGRIRSTIEQAAAIEGVTLTPAFKLNALHAMKELVQAGLGVAILPRSAVVREGVRQDVNTYAISAEGMEVPVYLAYTSAQPLGRAVVAIIDVIRDYLRELK